MHDDFVHECIEAYAQEGKMHTVMSVYSIWFFIHDRQISSFFTHCIKLPCLALILFSKNKVCGDPLCGLHQQSCFISVDPGSAFKLKRNKDTRLHKDVTKK